MDSQEAIEGVKALLDCNYIGSLSGEDIESLEMAIDTMKKYQKIVQIMERTVDDGTSMYDTLQEIEEVIEDGNDD